MIKSYGLVDNWWHTDDVKFPIKVGGYIIHDFYNGNFSFKKEIQAWTKANNQWGRYPVVIEFPLKYERKIHQNVYYSLRALISLIRLLKYNRVFLAEVLSFENKQITFTTGNDSPRASSFLGRNEELTPQDFITLNDVGSKFKVLVKKKGNERLLRSVIFWDLSSCSGNFERKAVETFTCLETLFTTDSTEITYKLANRIAWFMGKNLKSRKDIFNKVRAGYRIRSKVVHGEKFVETSDLPAIQDVHKLARSVILKIFGDSLLFEKFELKNKDFEEYLSSLVLG